MDKNCILIDLIWLAYCKKPQSTALISQGYKLSYSQLLMAVLFNARRWKEQGVSSESTIVMVLPNSPEFIIAFYTASLLGIKIAPLPDKSTEDEIQGFCQQLEASFILSEKQYPAASQLPKILTTQADLLFDEIPAKDVKDLFLHFRVGSGNKDFLYLCSSGSMGDKKAILKTQQNLLSESRNFSLSTGLSADDLILCALPLYHAHGLGNCLMASLYSGAPLVLFQNRVPLVFARKELMALIEEYGITVFPLVPHMVSVLSVTPEETHIDCSSLRLCFSAGTPLSETLFQCFLQRWGVPIRQLYGCTEAGAISLNTSENPDEKRSSVGLPLGDVQLRVIDDQGQDVKEGRVGEVSVKSDAISEGAYCKGGAHQGWFNTGDLGYLDADGYLYITGRKSRFISLAGYKIDPVEVENVLAENELVKDVWVGQLHENTEIIALIVSGPDFDEAILRRYCALKLASQKVPAYIIRVNSIPRDGMGKVVKSNVMKLLDIVS